MWKIYNATYGGNFDAYTRINFESLFKFWKWEREVIFGYGLSRKKFKSFDEILNNVVILKEPEIRDVKYDFCVGTEILNDILPKYTSIHIFRLVHLIVIISLNIDYNFYILCFYCLSIQHVYLLFMI